MLPQRCHYCLTSTFKNAYFFNTLPDRIQRYRCANPECEVEYASEPRTEEIGYKAIQSSDDTNSYFLFDTRTGEFVCSLKFPISNLKRFEFLQHLSMLPRYAKDISLRALELGKEPVSPSRSIQDAINLLQKVLFP